MSNSLIKIAEDSVRGGFYLFMGKTVSSLILAVGYVVIARVLGPESYGLYSLTLALLTTLATAIDLGLGQAMTRFTAGFRARGQQASAASLLRAGYLSKILIGLSASIVCLILSDPIAIHLLNRPEAGILIRIASPLMIAQAVFGASRQSFMGLDRMEGDAVIMNLYASVKTVLAPLLVFVGFGVVGALTGHVLGYVSAATIGSMILLKHYRGLGERSNDGITSNVRTLLDYGFPLFLTVLITLFLTQYQNSILAFYASNTEIGNFNVAVTFSAITGILVYPLTVLFPAFSKLDRNSSEIRALFKHAVKYTGLFLVPTSVLIACTSRELILTFYGSEYDLAPIYLTLSILIYLYTALGLTVFNHLLNGIGETGTTLKASLIGMAVQIPLVMALTTVGGVPGLIIASLISKIPSLTYLILTTKKKLNLTMDLRSSLKIYLTAFTSAIPLLIYLQYTPLRGLLNLILCGVLYLCTLLNVAPITRTVTKTDLSNLRAVLKRNKILRSLVDPFIKYEEAVLELSRRKKLNNKQSVSS